MVFGVKDNLTDNGVDGKMELKEIWEEQVVIFLGLSALSFLKMVTYEEFCVDGDELRILRNSNSLKEVNNYLYLEKYMGSRARI